MTMVSLIWEMPERQQQGWVVETSPFDLEVLQGLPSSKGFIISTVF